MFILLQAAKNLVLPPGLLFLLYGLGVLLQRHHRRTGRALRFAAAGALYLLCTGPGAWLLVHPLESLEPPLANPAGAQAIVVLSAGSLRDSPEYPGRDIPDSIALPRIAYAAHLQRQTGLPILVSGGRLASQDLNSLAVGMQRVFEEDYRIPVRWREEASRNTAENARYSALLLKAAGVRRVLLVTDAMHMRRARLCFERAGLEVVAAPTHYLGRLDVRPTLLLPSAENLRRAWYASYEWLGLLAQLVHPA